jgi:hypothetical protein
MCVFGADLEAFPFVHGSRQGSGLRLQSEAITAIIEYLLHGQRPCGIAIVLGMKFVDEFPEGENQLEQSVTSDVHKPRGVLQVVKLAIRQLGLAPIF